MCAFIFVWWHCEEAMQTGRYKKSYSGELLTARTAVKIGRTVCFLNKDYDCRMSLHECMTSVQQKLRDDLQRDSSGGWGQKEDALT